MNLYSSHHLKYIDPFSDQKQLSLTESVAAISALSSYLTSAIENNKVTDESIEATFDKLFHVKFVLIFTIEF